MFVSSADLFFKIIFSKITFINIFRVSNGLDPDQVRQSVGPHLGPNCLQRLSVDPSKERIKKRQQKICRQS